MKFRIISSIVMIIVVGITALFFNTDTQQSNSAQPSKQTAPSNTGKSFNF